MLKMIKNRIKKYLLFCVVVVCFFIVKTTAEREIMLNNISSSEKRTMICTDATIEMDVEEIIGIEGKPSEISENNALYYEGRDYRGNEGDGRLIFIPSLASVTWEISGSEEELGDMYDEIRAIISQELEEELYSEAVMDTRICKWYDQNADMKIILQKYRYNTEWMIELFYYKVNI